jgi:hypothetical protein
MRSTRERGGKRDREENGGGKRDRSHIDKIGRRFAFPVYQYRTSPVFLSKLALFLVLCWRVGVACRDFTVMNVVPRERLQAFVERNLFSEGYWSQRQALVVLGCVAGDRFGSGVLWLVGRRRAVALWRQWWSRCGRNLQWNPALRRYIEEDQKMKGGRAIISRARRVSEKRGGVQLLGRAKRPPYGNWNFE